MFTDFRNMEATCLRCGEEEERLEHVILECEKPRDAELIIQRKLGFHWRSTPKMIA